MLILHTLPLAVLTFVFLTQREVLLFQPTEWSAKSPLPGAITIVLFCVCGVIGAYLLADWTDLNDGRSSSDSGGRIGPADGYLLFLAAVLLIGAARRIRTAPKRDEPKLRDLKRFHSI